jgi:PiT family inorganic phosphate transporter
MEHYVTYVALAAVFGLFMAWGIGANDVANAMGTSVGSKALTIRQAILVAAIFEFAGAVLAGGEVTSTIRKGIVDTGLLSNSPELLVHGMLASLLAAGIWLLVASRYGWPVSTTHSIVGAVVGFSAVGLGIDAVKWGKVLTILMSWVASPLVAGALSYMLFRSVQALILHQENPLERARKFVPGYIFLAGFILSLVTLWKGLKHTGINISTSESYFIAIGIGVMLALIGSFFINRIKEDPEADAKFRFHTVERVFAVLMVCTACGLAFAHGSNDVANAVGPVAAVVSIAKSGLVDQKSALPLWVLLLGGTGIVVGLATYGRRVIMTVGEKITHLTPSRGFAAELAASSTIVFASATGMPVSTTHTLVGAVLGVGMARGISAIDLGVVRNIFVSWVVTVPAGAILSITFFYLLNAILG